MIGFLGLGPCAINGVAFTVCSTNANLNQRRKFSLENPRQAGGLGFVEAGLTAMLVLAGVGAADAALATFAYRLASYWLPLPAGAAAWGFHAWRYRERPAPQGDP